MTSSQCSAKLIVKQITHKEKTHTCSKMSRVMRKPTFCKCENKDADNREADQRLCFRYTDSTIPLLSKCEISSLWPSSVAVQSGLCQTRSETRTLVFPWRGSNMFYSGFCSKQGIFSIFIYSEPLKLRSTFPGVTFLDKNAGIELFFNIICLLTFYLFNYMFIENKSEKSESFCFVKQVAQMNVYISY